jgi:tetratricopeptide (TPR) repeat protein
VKITHTIAAHLLVLAFPICTAKALPPPSPDPEGLYSNQVGKSPAEVIDHYEQHAPATSADFFTLALAHYATADFSRALDLANRALALQSDPVARSVCFALIAECHGALGQYNLAAEAALQGLRLKCGNKELNRELAALRYAYATQAKDDLAVEAAKEHLMQLDSNFARHPTMEPITIGLVVIVIVCATVIVMLRDVRKEQDPEIRKLIAKSLERFLIFATAAALLMTKVAKTAADPQ